MTSQLPSPEARLDEFIEWREWTVEEAWEMAGFDGDAGFALANSLHITDLQHWLDLCA